MTFRRTPYTPYTPYDNEDESSNPYSASSWTASREPRQDVSHEAAQARAPEAGVPLRRPTETDEEYAYRAELGADVGVTVHRMSYEEYLRDDDLAQKVDEMANCICIDINVDPTCPSHGIPDEDPIKDTSPAGYDAHDFAKDK